MSNAVLTLYFLLFAVVPLFSQQQEPDEPKLTGRRAWLIYTSLPEGVGNPIKVMSGEEIIEVALSKRSVSKPVKIPSDGVLRIVREEPNPVDATKVVYRMLGQALIAEEIKQALIILVPLAKPQGDLVFNAKVQDLEGFKGGDWLFMNLTNTQIGVQFGETKISVKSGGLSIHKTANLVESTTTPISYHYLVPGKNQWDLISASTIALHPTRREICLFSADPRYGRIDYHGITFPVE